MDFNDDTPLGHGEFITDDEFKLLQLDEDLEKDIIRAQTINMKKLCRWFDKHNSEFIGVKVNILNKEMEQFGILQRNLFNYYFVDNLNIHKVAKETGLSIYKVNRELNKICLILTNVDGLLIKQ